jgi:hypothetical protein
MFQDLPAVAARVKKCSRSYHEHYVKSYAHFMLTGQSPGIESKVMLTLCSPVNLRSLCQKLCSRYAHWSISGHYAKSYAHIMLTRQSPGIMPKVMLTLCSRSISGHYVKSYAHFMRSYWEGGVAYGKNVTLPNGKFCKELVYFNFTPCGAGFIINCLNTDIDTFHQELSI